MCTYLILYEYLAAAQEKKTTTTTSDVFFCISVKRFNNLTRLVQQRKRRRAWAWPPSQCSWAMFISAFIKLLEQLHMHIVHIASRSLPFPIVQVCSQVWCRPYLAANFGFFEFRMFPWSPSKAEVGTFYFFPLKVSPRILWLFLKALVWSQVLSRQNREIK